MKQLANLKKNTFIILIITFVILYFVLKDDFTNIQNSFQNVNIKYTLIAIIFYFISLFLRGYSNYLIINDKEKVSLLEAVRLNIVIQFINGITPFATGGQPVEMYLLTKHNIPATKAMNQTIQGFIFYQIALVICGMMAVLYNYFFPLFPKIKMLQYGVFGGFLINIGVVIFLLSISLSKTITTKIVKTIIKVLKIMKIKINEEKVKEKIEEYSQGFIEIKKRRYLTSTGIILNVLGLLFLYTVPLFVIKAVDITRNIGMTDILVASSYVYIIGSFIPVPGSSGGIEYAFSQFVGCLIPKQIVGASLILWRTITYYVGMVMGAILLNVEKKEKK